MLQYIVNPVYGFDMPIMNVVELARNPGNGPMPRFTDGGFTANIYQDQSQTIVLNPDAALIKCLAYGIQTCAAVILYSTTSPEAAVYHAGAGLIPDGTIETLYTQIHTPALPTLYVIYAAPGNDKGYHSEALKFETFGVPSSNVVYLDFKGNTISFGINSRAQIGF